MLVSLFVNFEQVSQVSLTGEELSVVGMKKIRESACKNQKLTHFQPMFHFYTL